MPVLAPKLTSTLLYCTAIMYECVLTCAKIYPSTQLIEMAAGNVGRFLRSGNNNLKCVTNFP